MCICIRSPVAQLSMTARTPASFPDRRDKLVSPSALALVRSSCRNAFVRVFRRVPWPRLNAASNSENCRRCQALRRRIGHILFGMRVVHGECIFVTASPNRRNSALILKLSRGRPNDGSFRSEDTCTKSRYYHCGPNSPQVFVDSDLGEDPTGESASATLHLPSMQV